MSAVIVDISGSEVIFLFLVFSFFWSLHPGARAVGSWSSICQWMLSSVVACVCGVTAAPVLESKAPESLRKIRPSMLARALESGYRVLCAIGFGRAALNIEGRISINDVFCTLLFG